MKDNLILTARRRSDGLKFPPVHILADPDNTRELLRHLAALARQHDRKVGRASGWLREYDLIVRSPGRLEFVVSGDGSEVE